MKNPARRVPAGLKFVSREGKLPRQAGGSREAIRSRTTPITTRMTIAPHRAAIQRWPAVNTPSGQDFMRMVS
jgi:hypothetical protein